MSTSTTRKPRKTKPAETIEAKAKEVKGKKAEAVAKADEANRSVVKQAIEIAKKTHASEFPLLKVFAELFLASKMTTRGYKETLEAIKAEGYLLATFKPSDGQNLTLMYSISRLPQAPENARVIASKADAIRKNYGVEKAREVIEQAIEAGKTYADLKTPSVKKSEGSHYSKGSSLKLDEKTVKSLIELVTAKTKKAEKSEGKLAEALLDLQISIEAHLELI